MKTEYKYLLIAFIVFTVFICSSWFWLFKANSKESALGLTRDQVRNQFGKPDAIHPYGEGYGDDDVLWVYFHGWSGSSIWFEDGIAVTVRRETPGD
ncbi:MAG: hypothetical protein AAF086_10215 [Planctomycetota bacterium]